MRHDRKDLECHVGTQPEAHDDRGLGFIPEVRTEGEANRHFPAEPPLRLSQLPGLPFSVQF